MMYHYWMVGRWVFLAAVVSVTAPRVQSALLRPLPPKPCTDGALWAHAIVFSPLCTARRRRRPLYSYYQI